MTPKYTYIDRHSVQRFHTLRIYFFTKLSLTNTENLYREVFQLNERETACNNECALHDENIMELLGLFSKYCSIMYIDVHWCHNWRILIGTASIASAGRQSRDQPSPGSAQATCRHPASSDNTGITDTPLNCFMISSSFVSGRQPSSDDICLLLRPVAR